MIKKPLEFVVAHFNEDLSWLQPIAKYVHVYTKSGKPEEIDARNYTDCSVLKNNGREGHTYLTHILTQYDKLADVTVFCQGRVSDHIEISALDMRLLASGLKSSEILTFGPRDLELFDAWDGQHGGLVPDSEEFQAFLSLRHESTRKPVKAPHRAGHYFAQYIGAGKVPLCIGFQPAAIFAVPKELILRRPRNFYHNLLNDLFGGPMFVNDPETGHFLERFWLSIFKPEEYICWNRSEVSETAKNPQGQSAKGRWLKCPQAIVRDSVPVSKSRRRASDYGDSGDAGSSNPGSSSDGSSSMVTSVTELTQPGSKDAEPDHADSNNPEPYHAAPNSASADHADSSLAGPSSRRQRRSAREVRFERNKDSDLEEM